MGAALCAVGVIILVSGEGGLVGYGVLMFITGLIVYGAGRLFAWWSNG